MPDEEYPSDSDAESYVATERLSEEDQDLVFGFFLRSLHLPDFLWACNFSLRDFLILRVYYEAFLGLNYI